MKFTPTVQTPSEPEEYHVWGRMEESGVDYGCSSPRYILAMGSTQAPSAYLPTVRSQRVFSFFFFYFLMGCCK